MLALTLIVAGVTIAANAARRFARVRSCSVVRDLRRTALAVVEWVASTALIAAGCVVALELSAVGVALGVLGVAGALIAVVNGARTVAIRHEHDRAGDAAQH